MPFLLCGGGLRDGQLHAVSGGHLRPLQQVLIGLVPALCSVGGCPKVTVDPPLAPHRVLPQDVVSPEGSPAQLSGLAASHGEDDEPSAAVLGWCEQSKICHL
jgi:hypothetical protein